jgi:amino acid transporter
LYIFVNIGYFVFVYRDRSTFTWTKAIIPALGVIFSAAVLYKSFLQALWNAGWVTIGRGIVVFALIWTILGFGYAYLVRNRAKTPRIEAEVPLDEPGGEGLVLEPLEPGILGIQDTDPPPPEA